LIICWAGALIITGVTSGLPSTCLVGAGLGCCAGILQRYRLVAEPEKFEQAETALAVRRALTAAPSGQLAVLLGWVSAALLMILALRSGSPAAGIVIWFSGYIAFMLTRDLIGYTGLDRANQLATSRTIYQQLIAAHDLDEYYRAGGTEPAPRFRVSVRFDNGDAREGGFYMPDEGELPRVFIYRAGLMDDGLSRALDLARQATDPLHELLWFAHELGHHQVVLHQIGTGIRDDHKPLESYAEEVQAWAFARQLLSPTPFSAWDELKRVSSRSLETYETGWGLDPATAANARERAEAVLERSRLTPVCS